VCTRSVQPIIDFVLRWLSETLWERGNCIQGDLFNEVIIKIHLRSSQGALRLGVALAACAMHTGLW